MTPAEAATLLAMAAAFDNRKPDADAATAWAMVLDGLRFEDCRDAVMGHFRESTDWLMPAVVRSRVSRIRRARLDAFGPIPDPPDDLPDAEFTQWRADVVRRIGDGETVERLELVAASPEHVERLKKLMAANPTKDANDD